MRRVVGLLLLTAVAGAVDVAEWTPEHSMQFRTVGHVLPSPDGKLVVWTETHAVMTAEKSEFLTHIFLGSAGGNRRLQLTRGDKSATEPAFSPDGRYVYFTSERSGKKNLYRIAVAGGESEPVTDWKGSMGRFALSPDGKRAAFAGGPEDWDRDQEKRKKSKTDFRIIGDNPRNHTLWLVALDREMPALPRKLVDKPYHVGLFDWSPDSKKIGFEHRPRPDADEARHADIAEVDAATGDVRVIAAAGKETESEPLYSPDGRFLAFLFSPNSRLDGNRIRLLNRESGAVRELPDTADSNPNVIGWTADSRSLLYSEPRGTRYVLSRMPVDGPPETLLAPARGNSAALRMNGSGTHVGLTIQTPDEPVEAYAAPLERGRLGKPVRVSSANAALPKPPLGRTEVIGWKSKDGRDVEGLLTLPVGFEKGRRVPLILNIHGGPSGVFTESFTGAAGQYPIASFASKGFAVLRPNPRGSTGYGVAARKAVIQDWGGRDFEDLMTGVDHAIAAGIADPQRLAVMGWSYGGYMTAWAVTQTTRFKAAAIGAGITNHVSMYGTQDIPSVFEDYFGGPFWAFKSVYARSSPIEYVDRVRTPTLILHGEADQRVPVGQAHEFYRALKRQGVEVQMVTYPRMPHGPNEPKFQQDIMERHLAWALKHLR